MLLLSETRFRNLTFSLSTPGISGSFVTSKRTMNPALRALSHFPGKDSVRYETDLFVAGGGPAGLAAAIAARAKGFQVVVADGSAPPIGKPCGEGLLPDAVAALRELGVTLGCTDGHALRGIRFEGGGTSVHAAFRQGFGLGVRREVLHQRMFERAEECGVSFLWNCPVTGLWDSGVIAGGDRIRARWIIGADGIRSRIRRWAGLEAASSCSTRFAFREHYRVQPWSNLAEVHWHGDDQIYVTPVSPEEICIAVLSKAPNSRVGAALKNIRVLARRLDGASPASIERGAVTRMCRLRRVTRRNVALVGDSSGTVDAITAEGLSLSFRQAAALAEALEVNNLELYEASHRRLALRSRFMGNVLLFLSRRHAIRNRAFQAMQAAPEIFECMLAYHLGETRPLELAATGAQFSWRFLTA